MFTTAFVLRFVGLFVVLFLVVLGVIGLLRGQSKQVPETPEPTLLGQQKVQDFSLNAKDIKTYEESE